MPLVLRSLRPIAFDPALALASGVVKNYLKCSGSLGVGATGVQARAKPSLLQIQEQARRALQHVVAAYETKYEKAVECLVKDREGLLAFFVCPAEHWRHLRTTNLIQGVLATVRPRTVETRGCLSRKTAFSAVLSAHEKWRRLNGPKRLAELLEQGSGAGRRCRQRRVTCTFIDSLTCWPVIIPSPCKTEGESSHQPRGSSGHYSCAYPVNLIVVGQCCTGPAPSRIHGRYQMGDV